jgi:hypothetical protein
MESGAKTRRRLWVRTALAVLLLTATLAAQSTDWNATGNHWWAHVEYLASDELEGRNTGTAGYMKAAQYVARQFQDAGLEPAGTNGYLQEIAFDVKQIDESRSRLELIRADEAPQALKLGEDAMLGMRGDPTPFIEAPAVFVGYGFSVPEENYDELAGLDLQGKIAIYLTGGPPSLPANLRSHYQSAAERWSALRRAGAVGLAVIQNPRITEISWERQAAGRFQPSMELADPELRETGGLRLSLTINPKHADKFFAGSGHSIAEVLAAADADRPLPKFPLAVTLRARVEVNRSQVRSPNVIGRLPGADPGLQSEHVVLSAHLDHLGRDPQMRGDNIHNGAMDNATGAASLIEIARWFRETGARPKRSLLFVALTGEEKGLLGSTYFSARPTVASSIIANLNMDMFLPLFPFKYLQVYGIDESSLGDDAREVARANGIEAQQDQEPQANRFIRSDQYSFIRKGIPALAFKFGYLPDTPESRIFADFVGTTYHSPSDDTRNPHVNRAGAAQFNHILAQLALRVADASMRPAWRTDSFFRRFAAPTQTSAQ